MITEGYGITPAPPQRGPYEVIEFVSRAVFRTCTVHGYGVEHAKVVLNNGEYFYLCESCYPKTDNSVEIM